MNCYVLLAEVFTASDCHKLAAACWIATIAFHPQYPRLWQSLGNAYAALLQEDMQKLCFTRAKNLSATFEKSLPESFAKSAYNAAAISSSMSENEEETRTKLAALIKHGIDNEICTGQKSSAYLEYMARKLRGSEQII